MMEPSGMRSELSRTGYLKQLPAIEKFSDLDEYYAKLDLVDSGILTHKPRIPDARITHSIPIYLGPFDKDLDKYLDYESSVAGYSEKLHYSAKNVGTVETGVAAISSRPLLFECQFFQSIFRSHVSNDFMICPVCALVSSGLNDASTHGVKGSQEGDRILKRFSRSGSTSRSLRPGYLSAGNRTRKGDYRALCLPAWQVFWVWQLGLALLIVFLISVLGALQFMASLGAGTSFALDILWRNLP